MSTDTPTVRLETSLANTRVLVTRPAPQAEELVKLIEGQGGEAIRFPLVEILNPHDSTALLELIDRIDQFDMAIFVSRNAVNKAMDLLVARGVEFPQHVAVACIGRGSARELKRIGITTPIVPRERFDSEGLLALPEFRHVDGKKIIILRGEGGRELLGNTLAERGAYIKYAECYRRRKPKADITPLLRQWAKGGIDIVSVTSVEGLRNLFDLAGTAGRELLIKTPIVVISQRMATVSRELGIRNTLVAKAANDDAIVEAIKAWRTAENPL